VAHPYHSIADLVPDYVPEADLVQLTNDAGGATVDTDVYEGLRARADGEIDGYLGHRYTVPLSTPPALVVDLSARLTLFKLYRRRYPTDLPDSVVADQKAVMRTLEGLAKGIPTLGAQPAPTANPERIALVTKHTKVFSRDSLKGW